MEPRAGQVIGGRYRLDAALGRGGMGLVWAATHLPTGSPVAAKFILTSHGPRADLKARFMREARAVAAVQHPNVVQIRELLDEADAPVIIMPLLRGETLGARLARVTTLDFQEAIDLFCQVVSGVGACHALGIVHRDLKPDNVFLVEPASAGLEPPSSADRSANWTSDPGVVRLLDFGVAKLLGSAGEGETLTRSGAILGTPCYMSPEQGFGERDVDHRADIWSIGAMFYECLTGGRPVEGINLGQVLKRFMTEGITPIEVLAPDLPPPVAAMVTRMLARERHQRPDDLREVHQLFAAYSGRQTLGFGPPATGEDEDRADAIGDRLRRSSGPTTAQPLVSTQSASAESAVAKAPWVPVAAPLDQPAPAQYVGREQTPPVDLARGLDSASGTAADVAAGPAPVLPVGPSQRLSRGRTAAIGALALSGLALGAGLLLARAEPELSGQPLHSAGRTSAAVGARVDAAAEAAVLVPIDSPGDQSPPARSSSPAPSSPVEPAQLAPKPTRPGPRLGALSQSPSAAPLSPAPSASSSAAPPATDPKPRERKPTSDGLAEEPPF